MRAQVVFTGPGKARDYIEKSRPLVVNNPLPRWWDSTSDIGAGPYVPATPLNGSNIFPPSEGSQDSARPSPRNSGPESLRQDKRKSEVDRSTKAIPSAQVAHTRSPANRNGIPPENGNHTPRDLPPMMFTRRPSTTPVLLPEFRYCHKDEFVRPMRAHHCRACGTCILKYDHHWIGQCVGAHNHKFFVNFLQWALLFCSWTFATLLAATVKSNSNPNRDIDPQQVVVIAVAGLFTLFSGVLLVTHIRLILLNLSTLESLGVARMEEREKAVLARLHSCYEIRAKRGTRKLWDEEWGSIITDGNLWSLGKYSQNWEAVMGHKLYEWFLPVGHSDGDGLTYPTNPRFDKEGRWRPRREWPAELR
ncbi:hypothetical protein NLI96_g375 [Meripilus lineatus]|uniref:Palmitoyltransferase n=1 Tax=Meripilus lineatus TaxID=2056292 RepID=A0AAD5VCI2_9APHY|nr:hypothetical protein NLI96_g375 [Physisporinus lineatus]